MASQKQLFSNKYRASKNEISQELWEGWTMHTNIHIFVSECGQTSWNKSISCPHKNKTELQELMHLYHNESFTVQAESKILLERAS